MNEITLLNKISIASEISPEWDIPLRWDISVHMKRPLDALALSGSPKKYVLSTLCRQLNELEASF